MNGILLTNGIRKYLLLAAMLLAGTLTAGAQNLYVIHNGDNYLSHNATTGAVNTTRATSFDPTTCFWIISGSNLRPVNGSGAVLGDLYLRPRDGNYSYSLNTSTSTNYTGWSGGLSNGGQPYYDATFDRYLRLNGTTWEVSTTNNTRGTIRLVDVSTVSSTSTNPNINGADVLTATGNSTYTAIGATYRAGGYTNYRFNNADHFFSGNTAITPANATLTYAWSLEDNAYATVNNSGVVTVSSLPEYDITLTLTVTATATGGTPAAPAGTTLTASKTITIQGTKPSAPIISVSGNTVTLSTDATGSTSIRYTLNGTDPTPSTGTVYSSAIDLSTSANSPITIKAITVRNGNASDVTEQTVTLTLPAPTITINGEAQTATISSSVAGATIYYTTDGTTPTTSSSQYTGTLTGLAYMTNVKAIAVKDGWNNSPEASGIVTIPSGVSGGVVTLFDYEPHSWSYYSDASLPAQLHSLSPADVKITYYGDGIVMSNNDNYTAGTSNYVSPGNANYVGGAKVNVGGENENTFIYYKTLERGDATDATWTFSSGNQSSAASRCPYTPIYNPFQVRPTYGSRGTTDANNFTGWRGFQCWRLKSVTGGAVYSAASGGTALTTGAVINAGTEIYFAPNSEYGMDVQFEAVWARAYLIKGNNAEANAILNHGDLGVERNFMTLTTNENYRFNGTTGRRITNVDRAVTISCYYPSGEAPDNTGGVVTGNNSNITLGAATKFENVRINVGGNYITASGYDLIIGRGCTSSTAGTVYGNNANSNINQTVRIESGTYTNFYPIGSDGPSNNITKQHIILGCDYDRAKTDDAKMKITDYIKLIQTNNHSTGTDKVKIWVKSGTYQDNQGSGTAENSNNCFYLWSPSTNNTGTGTRTMIVEGGQLWHIAGGLDCGNNANSLNLTVRVKGGTIRGSVFGGAARYDTKGYKQFIFTGGTVRGWIAGGSNGYLAAGTYGAGTEHGTVTGRTYLYVGGTTSVGGREDAINMSIGGYVFGAGCGNTNANTNAGSVTEETHVVIADEAYVKHGVYGGGAYGSSLGTANVYVLGNAVIDGDDDNSQNVIGGVFGGARQKGGQTVNITMKGGTINKGGLFGGSNATGTISGNVTMQIDGGQVGADDNHRANIHGGGYGQSTTVSGNVDLNLGTCNAASGATIYGDVYGGSALGAVNTNANNTTNVSLYKGTIYGGLYGGALGQTNPTSIAAPVRGAVTVNVYGGSVLCSSNDPQGVAGTGSVFGCNNVNGTPGSTVNVHIYNTDQPLSGYALHAVYGGGNKSAYTGIPVVTIHGCDNSIEYVYGGGNATDVRGTDVTIWGGTIGNAFAGGNGAGDGNPGANITADSARLVIHGGTIGAAFGGSNERGTINGGIRVTVKAATESGSDPCSGRVYEGCDMDIAELYGGGNRATIQSSTGAWHTPLMQLDCSAKVGMLFGGAKAANYTGNINLVVNGGTFNKVFGGNNEGGTITGNVKVTFNGGSANEVYGGCNKSGTITGTVIVNIDSTNATCTPRFYVGSVYGGGNLAGYSHPSDQYPQVNIINGTVRESVYGGGYGSTATVTGNPIVTVGSTTSGKKAQVLGNVFGGGNAAPVTGSTDVRVIKDSSVGGSLFGGGNAASVSANTQVWVKDRARVLGNIYGGGNQGEIGGNTKVIVNGN